MCKWDLSARDEFSFIALLVLFNVHFRCLLFIGVSHWCINAWEFLNNIYLGIAFIVVTVSPFFNFFGKFVISFLFLLKDRFEFTHALKLLLCRLFRQVYLKLWNFSRWGGLVNALIVTLCHDVSTWVHCVHLKSLLLNHFKRGKVTHAFLSNWIEILLSQHCLPLIIWRCDWLRLPFSTKRFTMHVTIHELTSNHIDIVVTILACLSS